MPPRILLCLDTDAQPSVFDAVVAIDAGVEQLLRHHRVTPDQVEGLVHGLMFTRAPADLRHSAVFIGGSDAAACEELLAAVTRCFFGPLRVSVLLDPSGCNTTAAAAIVAAARHVHLNGDATATVIGTGPVGERAALLLAGEGVSVRVVSRRAGRAAELCERLAARVDAAQLTPVGQDAQPLAEALAGADLLIAAGPAGVAVLPEAEFAAAGLKVAIDLNATPPLGIGGVEVTDKAVERHGCVCYGAIGIGGAKMRIHRAALERLFESNDTVLDAGEVYALGKAIA